MRDMSPDQILAINAGVSPDVAAVLVEQARASATNNDEKMALMREMVDAVKDAGVNSAEQARAFAEQQTRAVTGVAAGLGGNRTNDSTGGPDSDQVECPGCHHNIPVSDRFCRKCGRKMRD